MKHPKRKNAKMIAAEVLADRPVKRKVQYTIHLTPHAARMAGELLGKFGYVYDSELFEKVIRDRHAVEFGAVQEQLTSEEAVYLNDALVKYRASRRDN